MSTTADFLSVRLQKLCGVTRTDLAALDLFVPLERLVDEDGSDAYSENGLFWAVLRPAAAKLDPVDDPHGLQEMDGAVPALPREIEDASLARLDSLEREYGIPYVPDWSVADYVSHLLRQELIMRFGEDESKWRLPTDFPAREEAERLFWKAFDRLISSPFLSSARALALRRRDGYSDEVRDTLKRALGVRNQCAQVLQKFLPHEDDLKEFRFELDALSGYIQIELFRASRASNEWEAAVRYVAKGLYDLSKFTGDPADLTYDDCTASSLAQEAVDTFEELWALGKSERWEEVLGYCDELKFGPSDLISPNAEVIDAEGNLTEWFEFWQRAVGRVEARLTRDELWERVNEAEDKKAQRRLMAYFFVESLWEALPDRARRALVEADRTWVDGRAGLLASILGNLAKAAESLCYEVIWEPLKFAKGGRNLLEFSLRDKDLSDKGHEPSLDDYAWACKRPFFKESLAEYRLSQGEVDFLIKELPDALTDLRLLRNRAEHESRYVGNRHEIGGTFGRFVGIDRPGVLPHLAEIKLRMLPLSFGKQLLS